jgi:hypothetical protein
MSIKTDKEIDQQPKIYKLKRHGRSFQVSRRDFIKLTGTYIAAASLSSCFAQPDVEVIPPTSTKVPSETPSPTPTRTQTPTPTKIPVTAKIRTQGARLREAPNTSALVIGALAVNVVVTVIGKLEDASWLQLLVNLTDLPALKDAPIAQDSLTVTGWMRADLLEILSDSLEDVLVVEVPPTPTPLPNEKPTGKDGITYKYTDLYGNTHSYTLPCGAPIPTGAICTCNCVSLCSCVGYVAPCSCDTHKSGGGTICTCDMVTYWYPN